VTFMIKTIIVDDHVLFREGLASIISSEPDIEIAGMAGTVQEAVELSQSVKPDVILMDFNLPDGTGAEASRLILEDHPECKVIFLTMSEKDEDLFAAIRSGARGYLLKNMRPQKLVAAIRSVQKGEAALSRLMTMHVMEELSRTEPTHYTEDVTITLREIDVLKAIAAGLSNQEISQQLYISENTVKSHVHSILEKLNLSDRKEAAEYARKHGLLKQG
jgi:two-component system nitrate/nitrite response regulator NarL